MSGISIGGYDRELLSSISELGGKLGVLDFLRKNSQLSDELRKMGIHISPGLQILPQGNTFDGINIEKLVHDSENAAGFDDNPFFMVRGSVPGDFRSLVDVIPTTSYPTRNIRAAISEGVERIIQGVQMARSDILKYSRGMNVPYNEDELRIGVTPYFHVPILTATEHPNNDGALLLDTSYGNFSFGGHNIEAINYNFSDGNEVTKSSGDSRGGANRHGNMIGEMLAYLRKNRVFDPNVAYQFEFGVYQEFLFLFQVREFCKKHAPVSPVSEVLKNNGRALFSALVDGESLENVHVVKGEYHEPWERIMNDPNEDKKFLLAGTRTPNLFTDEYDSRIVAQFHSDASGGALNHESFRTAQAVMQNGGVVGLGHAYTGYKNPDGSITSFKSQGGNIHIGTLESELGGRTSKIRVPFRKK